MYKKKIKLFRGIPRKIMERFKEEYKLRKNDYVEVYIFDSKEEMYEYVDKKIGKQERDYLGMNYSFSKVILDEEEKIIKVSPMCGYIFLEKNNVDSATLPHECMHATLGYFTRKLPEIRDNMMSYIDKDTLETKEEGDIFSEELFCYILGNLISEINGFYFNIIPEEEEKNDK